MIKGTKLFKITGLTNVDPKTFNQYEDWEDAIENNSYASTDDYIEKAKANYRWMLMSMNLNKGLETLSGIKINGGSSSEVPSSIDFILTYTQPDALWYKDEETGEIEDDKIKVIEKIIKDTLNQEYNVILTYFDKDNYSSNNDKIYSTKLPFGTTMKEVKVEAVDVSPTIVDLEDEEGISYHQFLPEEE